ncbi:MAG: EAL domain-containing protein [Eubacterium sp.]|nr:EAL domain-containing protein [Eubacterium sp.]
MGIYTDVDKTLTVENWIDRAKTACDRIRGDYSRHVEYYSKEFYERSKYHEKLITDIDDAITNNDLIVYYQPKHSIQGDTPALRSAEALIRWKHPELGMINPGDFTPLYDPLVEITELLRARENIDSPEFHKVHPAEPV